MDPNTAQTSLNRCILDYLNRRGFELTAACFEIEARLCDEPPANDGQSGKVTRNPQTRTPTNQQLASPQTSHRPIHNVPMRPLSDDESSLRQSHTSSCSSRMHLSRPINVAQQSAVQDDQQKGPSSVPEKVFRRESRKHQTTGQLRLKPKSNKGGEVAKDHPSRDKNVAKGGLSFKEVETFFTSNDIVLCCHFSSDGKLLATAGNDKMVSVWNVESLCHLGNTPQQSNMITDVRFMPHSTVFATSSFDTTIRLWDAANISKFLVELHGHADRVISVDFNPHEREIVCSCDCNGEIRLWNINERASISIYKVDVGMGQIRFQFRNLLAVASGNMILMIDIETDKKERLQGHARDIQSICWDQSGRYLASVSEDSARVWSTKSGWKCDYELYSTENMFKSCTFHPVHSLLLVIGGFQIFEFWDCVKGSKTRSIQLHAGIISSMTYSPEAGLIASTSNDGHIRLWR